MRADLKDDQNYRTELGRKLQLIRNKAIQKGLILLSEDEILKEVKTRRGEDDPHVQTCFY
jgi:hypothetical protein